MPQAALDRERDVLREQARATGKPDLVVDRMVEGRLAQIDQEFVLLEQIFVVDQETKDLEGRRAGRQDRWRADQR